MSLVTGVVVVPWVMVLPTHMPYSVPRARVPPMPVPTQMLSHCALRVLHSSMRLNCTPSFALCVFMR